MIINDCYGHNIYIDEELVGYINRNELIISNKKFADITDEGVISMNGNEVGFVDDDGSIIINKREVGYIDGDNNFVFYKTMAKF